MLSASGPLTAHMAAHILLMNLLGPAAAAMLLSAFPARSPRGTGPLLPTIVQMLLLWGWHAPPMLQLQSSGWHWAMSISLLSAATWFWLEIFRLESTARWRAIASLLVTSKLFCLLGVLYVFAPRVLYPEMAFHHGGAHVQGGLDDQQLAGLLMLIACPATYLLCGVWIAARWLSELENLAPQDSKLGAGQGAH